MVVYFTMMLLWAMMYPLMVSERKNDCQLERGKRAYFVYASLLLTLVMGLKKWTVGCDWVQYLNIYNFIVPSLSSIDILQSNRAGFYYLLRFLYNLGLGDQGFIFAIGLILSFSFGYFFYRFSDNMLLSFYLHVTIGMFTMSMSGIRQSLAVAVTLFAFLQLTRKRHILALLLVLLASMLHRSALLFLCVIPIMWIRINWHSGFMLWMITAMSIAFRKSLAPVVGYLAPEEYRNHYEMLSDAYRINPLLVLIALAIPLACLISHEFLVVETESKNDRYFSIFYVLSILYAFTSVLSLNSNIIGRLGFYFMTFNVVLLTNSVCQIRDKWTRWWAMLAAIALPMIQFVMSTPGGTLAIDRYLFFWQ